MKRLGFLLLLLAIFGCGSKKNVKPDVENENAFDYETFSKHYAEVVLPYQLSDTGLLNNKDTTRIPPAQLELFVADSIKKKIFAKTTGIRYIPLQKIENKKGESYFITKVVSGSKKAALLTVFNKKRDSAASFPFLIPDANNNTIQVSTIDKAYAVSRNVTQTEKNGIIIEGKDVYAYNAAINGFTLIMTDVLDDKGQELINPIDTFTRLHKFAGDYIKNKKNLVSIRDGRNASELNMFVHFENEDGECTGELKGSLFFTSSTTAVYRQGGDPCVLEFRFTPTSVSLREEEGCGSHRGLKCTFDGSFPRKMPAKQKEGKKKPAKK
jgi:hypothetical protein